jgi:hypothetical protein
MHTDFCPKMGQMGQMGRPTNGQEIDFSAHGPKWVDPFGPAHGFCPGLDSTSSLRPRSAKFRYLRIIALIIWDKVPMQDRYAVELVNRLLQDARDNNYLFSSLSVLIGGDFAQTLPIVVLSSRTRTIATCLQRSLI